MDVSPVYPVYQGKHPFFFICVSLFLDFRFSFCFLLYWRSPLLSSVYPSTTVSCAIVPSSFR